MTPSRDDRLQTLQGAVDALSEMEDELQHLGEDLKDVALPNLAFGAAELQGQVEQLRQQVDRRLRDERPED